MAEHGAAEALAYQHGTFANKYLYVLNYFETKWTQNNLKGSAKESKVILYPSFSASYSPHFSLDRYPMCL